MKINALIKIISLFIGIGSIALVATFFITVWGQVQQSSQSLEISPPSQELQVNPGESLTVKVKVKNRSNETLPLNVRVEDFTASGEEGQVALLDQGDYSIVKWTSISPNTLNLKPLEEKEVTAEVTVPKNAAGGRYGALVFAVSAPGAKPGETAVSQEIASLFLVRISGLAKEDLSLVEMTTPKFLEFGPIPFSLKFKNNGNIHSKTYGLINVTNMFGQKLKDVVVTGTNIFPNASRIIKAELNNKFLFGSYTATALMYYGSQNQLLTSTASFIVFPVRLFVIIVIITIILYALRKRLTKAIKALLK